MAIQAQICSDNFGLPFGGSQDWLMNDNNITNNINNNNNFLLNSCGLNEFGFGLQQKLQQQFQYQQQDQQQQLMVQLQNLQQRNQYFCSENENYNHHPTSSSGSSHILPVNFSQSLATHVEKQRLEIDRYISLQNERLKLALQEQRKQQLALILKKIEEKAMILLRQKDEEIMKARNRTMELEEFTRKMEFENQAWQRVAAENEAMVATLSSKLEELKEQACCLTSAIGVEDAESCCNEFPRNREEDDEVEETGESCRKTEESNKKMMMMMMCRVCNARNSCILFLPCRHLSSCKACEAFLDSCPLCKSPKRATIEALLSS